MIKVLGRKNSINVQKVMWCAAELGVSVERKDVGGAFGGNDTPEYLAKNPSPERRVVRGDAGASQAPRNASDGLG